MLMLMMGVAAMLTGASMGLWPQRRADAVAQRMAEGDDRYFEEQRTYATNPKLRDPRSIRSKGWILIALGAGLLVLWWAGAP